MGHFAAVPNRCLGVRGLSCCFAMSALVLVSVVLGCGLKRDPVPAGVALPQAVSDLKVQRSDLGISVEWTMPADAANLAGFQIWRSEIETAGDSCPGCPREYLLLADLSLSERALVVETGGRFRYNDFTVQPGRLYAYRVVACYETGLCSEAQESPWIKFNEDSRKNDG